MIDEVFTASYDFVCFTATWQKECVKDAFDVKGYTFINKQRSFIHRKAKRGAGGILLQIKNTMLTKVVILNNKSVDDRIWQTVEAKNKTIGCWVRRRPLLPSSRMVSFSFSTIDYKSLTYGGRFRAYNRFPYRQKQLFQSKR